MRRYWDAKDMVAFEQCFTMVTRSMVDEAAECRMTDKEIDGFLACPHAAQRAAALRANLELIRIVKDHQP